jgi:triosephosphate isomerase
MGDDIRRPIMAGNWKMNLTHLEAILLVQKLAATLTEQQLADVEVAVLPAFTALRSVQTAIEGDKIPIRYGAQDCPRIPAGRTPAISPGRCWPSSAARTWSSGTPSAASTTTRTTS